MGHLESLWSAHFDSPNMVGAEMLKRWPSAAGRKLDARTLGNRLRDLDRGDNGWWTKPARRPIVRVLADVLGLDDEEVEALLRTPGSARHPAARPIAAVGDLQPLRLDQENLFPGLPPQALTPELWSRHWWEVHDSTTRDLIGLWHTHRQRTAVLRHATWDDAVDDLRRSGRVLLILDAQAEPVPALLPELPGLFLCVVAPCPAHATRAARDPAWSAITDPSPETWIEELIAWVRPRGHAKGGLRARRAATQLVQILTDYAGWLSGPRDALELCGLLEEIGCEPRAPRDLARRYVSLRWAHDETLAPRRAWLSKHGAANLIALVEEAVYRHGDTWQDGLPRAQWEELVPLEAHVRGVEQAHARLKDASRLDRGLRDELLAALEPGPRYFVDDLCGAGILSVAVGERLRIEPRWLAGCLLDAALEETRARPLGSWMERLTQPAVARDALLSLIEHWRRGIFERIDELLARPDGRDMPHGLAVDLCFRAAGLARLLGAELSPERVAALWQKLPLILAPSHESTLPPSLFSSSNDDWMLGHEGFAVSVVLLSELLPEGGREPFESLWRPGLSHNTAWTVLRPVDALFQRFAGQPSNVLDGLLKLGERWFACCGEIGRPHGVREILMPAWLVAQFLGDAPSKDAFRVLTQHRLGDNLPGLMQRHCELHEIDFANVVRRCWSTWDPAAHHKDEQHPWYWCARDRPAVARLVWPHLPAELVRDARGETFLNHHNGVFPNAWRLFGRDQWEAWFEAMAAHVDDLMKHMAWGHMPKEIVLEHLLRGDLEQFNRNADGFVWLNLKHELVEHLPELWRRCPSTAWRLVTNAPEPQRLACLEAVSDWLGAATPDDFSAHAETFLRGLVASRSPLAPRAWAVLRQLQAVVDARPRLGSCPTPTTRR